MIDWLAIIIALVIIASLVGGFGFLAWKINMSDPLARDGNDESVNDKRKKEKNSNEQSKKKRKDQKKWKRESKDEDEKQPKKGKSLQAHEETDDEREESEQELLNAPVQTAETSSKARKRNKNKTRSTTPPPPSSTSESHTKNPVAIRAPPVTHPKSAPKDELESTKQQTKVQTSNKQTLPTSVNNKKPTQNVQKRQQQEDQSFTVVGNNRHKNTTSTVQQNKPQVTPTPPVAPVQQTTTAPVQHEQLVQRQQPPPPQKETPTPVAAPTVKQSPPKIADLIKVLPSSQVVVTELMSALDAFPLSPDELDIIMHKIANKQSVVKQDWNKLQQGQKVDPQAHIGQVLDESAKAYEDDLKHNSVKRVKELTAELNAEQRRNNDLLKEKSDKEREIQILHAQLDSTQHKVESPTSKVNPQQKLQSLELQLQRVTEDNIHLTQQLAQHTASTLTNTNDAGNVKLQVLSDQMKKLSVDNANLEKKAHSNELLAKEAHKEKEDLIRYNEQLTQSLQKAEKDLKHVEEKHHKQLNDARTTNLNEINEYKNRLKQLENENEQLKREEIVHVEPSTTTDIQTITINNEEREQLENEIQQLKQTIELNRQKQDEQHESRNNELNALRVELNESKSTLSRAEERLRQQRQVLADLLSQDLRKQLPNDNQDFDQWLSSYRQLSESNKQNLHEESEKLKRENVQLIKNMNDIENQLKEIENAVQSKEETLLKQLKSKDAIVEQFRNENDQLKNEIQHLQSIHQASVSEARALKLQLDERFLVAANTPSIVAADESFELVKQLSPSQSPIVIDMRAEQLNELIRSSKEALENQDSATQLLDKHLNDMQNSGLGETSTVSSSSNQQS